MSRKTQIVGRNKPSPTDASQYIVGAANRLVSFIKDFSRFFHTRSDSNTAEIHAYLSGLMQAKRGAKNLERMEEDVPDFNYQAVHNTISHSPWDYRPLMEEIARRADGLLGGAPRCRLVLDDVEGEQQKLWWLLVWENPDERTNHGSKVKAPRRHYALSNASADEDPRVLICDGLGRNVVERNFRDGKSEVGMANYQTRSWLAWHHHMSLVMLALLFLMQDRRTIAGQEDFARRIDLRQLHRNNRRRINHDRTLPDEPADQLSGSGGCSQSGVSVFLAPRSQANVGKSKLQRSNDGERQQKQIRGNEAGLPVP